MKQDTNMQSVSTTLQDILKSPENEQPALLAAVLDKFPQLFRVLRSLNVDELIIAPAEVPEGAGFLVVADTETTGTDNTTDDIIELGMVEVAYDREIGYIYGVTRVFNELEDPGRAIPAQAAAVNGITDEMVAGKRISDAEVDAFVKDADLVICHNAKFDRTILERRFPVFTTKAFACSQRQVDWQAGGITGTKLDYIAMCLGFFFEGHRASVDCLALVKVLNTPMAGFDGQTPLQRILETYKLEARRIWATGAHFDFKDLLKKRGYHWHDPANEPGAEKAWAMDVAVEDFAAELDWLKAECLYGKGLSMPVDRINAYNRFTSRRTPMERAYR
ncbi:3'-5' exonuclease [Variovorax sp. WDL1]|uniref:3'-5' exonuclease n=2 Tax=Variovorax TaxID=34072 RepID=UPI00076BF4C0|nr:3'-5' exonuclease [Variovorax sp. WDL1]KWT98424.1 polymerase epsilon subunit [Variovorax sp. WDL1]PNG49907.1 DNA polymerase III PolC-type [Variovorax sp. B2]PNG50779.1 DNA polymerase III PolC-type [Variovorax sp. B4]